MYPGIAAGTDPRSTPRARELNLSIVAALHNAAAQLLLGTDTAKPGVLPGYSLHDEPVNFVSAGMSPYEALRAGTADAARLLDRSSCDAPLMARDAEVGKMRDCAGTDPERDGAFGPAVFEIAHD